MLGYHIHVHDNVFKYIVSVINSSV